MNTPTAFGINCRPLSSGSEEIQKKILQDSRLITIFCLSSLIFILIQHFSFLPIVGDEKDFLTVYINLNKLLKSYYNTMSWCFVIPAIIANSWFINTFLTLSMYITFQISFQFYLFADLVKNHITNLPVDSRNHLPEKVFNKLKECAISYNNVKR